MQVGLAVPAATERRGGHDSVGDVTSAVSRDATCVGQSSSASGDMEEYFRLTPESDQSVLMGRSRREVMEDGARILHF